MSGKEAKKQLTEQIDMERDKLSVIVIRVKAYKAVFLHIGEAIY